MCIPILPSAAGSLPSSSPVREGHREPVTASSRSCSAMPNSPTASRSATACSAASKRRSDRLPASGPAHNCYGVKPAERALPEAIPDGRGGRARPRDRGDRRARAGGVRRSHPAGLVADSRDGGAGFGRWCARVRCGPGGARCGWSRVVGDRRDGWRVEGVRLAYADEARSPGSAVRPALELLGEARALDDRAPAASTGPEGRERVSRRLRRAQRPASGRSRGVSGNLRAVGSLESDDRRSPRGTG